MKKAIYTILISFTFIGCNVFVEWDNPDWEIPEHIETEIDALVLLRQDRFDYRYDPPGKDEWGYPDEIYYGELEGNDCEDMAILYVYLFHKCLGYDDVYMVGVENIRTGERHMIFSVNGVYRETTGIYRGEPVLSGYMELEYKVIRRWNYEEMLTEIGIKKSYY